MNQYQNYFKKIKTSEYIIPNFVSNLSNELISKILIVNPKNRITMSQIRQHPWFQYQLPAYLHYTPDMLELQEKVLDLDICEKVVSLSLLKTNKDEVELSIMQPKNKKSRTDVRVAYELLLDRKKSQEIVSEVAMSKVTPTVSQ
jgi:serine/threonine protein kinase